MGATVEYEKQALSVEIELMDGTKIDYGSVSRMAMHDLVDRVFKYGTHQGEASDEVIFYPPHRIKTIRMVAA